ncbi:hypothetical protein [Dactylosporangium sp. CS-033363]|uniref:hypothetical protein n=1 Tax=Dactylosporangium sp. CS-033363 TaxID=3239935 RepID=UPI003D8C50A0
MTDDRGREVAVKKPLLEKIGWTALTGFIAFSGSALLDKVLMVSLADQLVLTFIAGGSALLVQYLADFEQRLRAFERDQRRVLREMQDSMRRGFAGVSEATRLIEALGHSALNHEALQDVISRAGQFSNSRSPLVLRLADVETARLGGMLHHLSEGRDLLYDGEDREFLLTLTEQTRQSIMATAWTTIAGGEGQLWFTDLGLRYLERQRQALHRNVTIKRLFIFEKLDDMNSSLVRRILATQQGMGVEIRLLGGPALLDMSVGDFVVFDEEISHETSPVTSWGETGQLATRLVLDPTAVRNRVLLFQELWAAAEVEQRPTLDSHTREDRPAV